MTVRWDNSTSSSTSGPIVVHIQKNTTVGPDVDVHDMGQTWAKDPGIYWVY